MELSNKARTRLSLVVLAVLVGIVGEMDYRDAVKTEQAAKELSAKRVAKWTTYQISR